MTETPEQIARGALAELGETPVGDPVAQIRDIAQQATATLNATQPGARQLAALIHEDPDALEAHRAYGRALDRARTALVAAARIDHAQRLEAALQRIADEILADYPVHASEAP